MLLVEVAGARNIPINIDEAKIMPHDIAKEQPVRGDLTPVLCILSNELVC